MIRLVLGAVLLSSLFRIVFLQEAESEAQIEERLGKITESLVSYQRCRTDSDCRANSFCYDNDNTRVGLCKCQAGYELLFRNRTDYSCLKLATWGEECEISAQCVDNLGGLATCQNTCGCQEKTYRYPYDGRCYRSVLLDDFCRTDANCILEDGTYAFCTDGQCECNIGLRPSADRKRCVNVRNLGQNCSDDYQCSFIGNSVCREICRCAVGYVVSRNETTCLKAATYFFDSCEENAQCSEFLRDGICNNGNCTCESGYHGFETRCVRTARIGQACSASEQCVPSTELLSVANCTAGVCQCAPGATDSSGRVECSNNTSKVRISSFLFALCMLVYNLFIL
ncbi:prion-like-(Q/N-rich) domain-bearing protein 25 isoform X1 [Dendroctonus ponderosae]